MFVSIGKTPGCVTQEWRDRGVPLHVFCWVARAIPGRRGLAAGTLGAAPLLATTAAAVPRRAGRSEMAPRDSKITPSDICRTTKASASYSAGNDATSKADFECSSCGFCGHGSYPKSASHDGHDSSPQ
jgi:hypothetical protein